MEIKQLFNRFKQSKKQQRIALIQGLIILAVAILAIVLASNITEDGVVQSFVLKYGYWGLLLVAFVSGFNVFVPIPVITLAPILVAAGLHLPTIILVMTIGMTCGDTVGFLLGRAGRGAMKEKHIPEIVSFLEKLSDRHKNGVVVFYFFYSAFAPLPNEVAVVPGAFINIAWYKILIPVFFGNLVFNSLIGTGLLSIANLF